MGDRWVRARPSGPGAVVRRGWRWIFYVNLPVSVVAMAMTIAVIPESRDPSAPRVDLPGMAMFTIAAACLTYALIRGGWSSPATLGLLAAAVVALASFLAIEAKRRDPMLDLSLLRNRAFSALLIGGALLSAAAWADMAYESLWLQSVLGKSAIGAGLVLLPAAVMAFVVSAGPGRQMHRFSARGLVGTGIAIITAGTLAQAVVRSGSAAWVLMPGVTVVGVGAGLAMAPLTSAAMALVPHQKAGMAAGTLTTFRQLGYALGIAVLGEVFGGGLSRIAGSRLAPSLSGGMANAVMARGPGLSHLVREAFATGLDQTLVTAAGLGLAGTVTVFALFHIPPQPTTPSAAPASLDVTEPVTPDPGYRRLPRSG